jgi:hypothetical protein
MTARKASKPRENPVTKEDNLFIGTKPLTLLSACIKKTSEKGLAGLLPENWTIQLRKFCHSICHCFARRKICLPGGRARDLRSLPFPHTPFPTGRGSEEGGALGAKQNFAPRGIPKRELGNQKQAVAVSSHLWGIIRLGGEGI